ncbi:unnamed protein product [Polarella glacialis]|uniref:Carbonic anhydrase n=1 Tax=Polarella glacialis TaxID=89957 RepID=A0A813HZJ1_POLGL|nr:unnamed protein product [Polarella glacialis]|mmetsp:Transcript_24008/g.42926  ORF Transcript_24008/g.42926 Transcript_24008/m.42926 type:complete len:309 (-) Transcript_24008:46-972(-)|eukprot:CAMPEP_0115078718 /NCGR_PEP_ID=MMETSP0227-20121206/17703_1 /TAXON_ID=89957 /ORGANISM="Polarella glacialis, Strain CCMP 1383" /LENGTH=308 /DNA_ID=CAMNT_0002466131 /DNA_START=113 /DNA_END=1039 /DNA_ORIENTATION=+
MAAWQMLRRLRPAAGLGRNCRSFGSPPFFPNSWVEPDALWEFHDQCERTDVAKLVDSEAWELGDRNQVWRKQMMEKDPEFFDKIGKAQSPDYLWIGCSDSRVAAENLIGGKPGELFTHRNIANMVVATDTNMRSVLQYAVDYLKVRHIVVCGHYDCGGVKAAVTRNDHSLPLESWLSHVRDVYRMHKGELEAIDCEHERHKRLVELNVIEQCLNLFKTSDVQRRRQYTASRPDEFPCALPRIHGMVFSPGDGILRNLKIDFKDKLGDFLDIYNLYDDPSLENSARLDKSVQDKNAGPGLLFEEKAIKK